MVKKKMAKIDENYNPIEEMKTKISKQCATIRRYENIMVEFNSFIDEEHTVEEYKDFIKSHIWLEIM